MLEFGMNKDRELFHKSQKLDWVDLNRQSIITLAYPSRNYLSEFELFWVFECSSIVYQDFISHWIVHDFGDLHFINWSFLHPESKAVNVQSPNKMRNAWFIPLPKRSKRAVLQGLRVCPLANVFWNELCNKMQ
jgi:hypothetical protein